MTERAFFEEYEELEQSEEEAQEVPSSIQEGGKSIETYKRVFLSFTYLCDTGSLATGCALAQWDKKISTEDDIVELIKHIEDNIDDGSNVTLTNFQRME